MEEASDFFSAFLDMGFDGVFGDGEQVCDFADGEALEAMQFKYALLGRSQLIGEQVNGAKGEFGFIGLLVFMAGAQPVVIR